MLVPLPSFVLLTFGFHKAASSSCKGPINVIGTGTSSLAPLFQELAFPLAANRSVYGRAMYFRYERSSLNESVQRIASSRGQSTDVMFAATVSALDDEFQMQNPGLRGFPVFASAVLIIYNVPGVRDLVLHIAHLAAIYNGTLEYWNDPRIQQYNPTVLMPQQRIVLIARQDDNSDTSTFTSVLSRFDDDWAKTYGTFSSPSFAGGDCCNSTSWPHNVISYFGLKEVGLAGIVASIPYTIGYASLVDSNGYGVQVASLLNSFGSVVKPDVRGIQAAMDYHLESTHSSSRVFQISNAMSQESYPMATFTYLYINFNTIAQFSCCQMIELMSFLDWILLSTYSKLIISANNLVALSPAVAGEVFQSTLRLLSCHEQSVYDMYVQSTKIQNGLEIWHYAVIVVFTVAIVSIVVGVILFAKAQRRQMKDRLWLIDSFQVEMILQAPGESAANTGRESKSTATPTNRTDSTKTTSKGLGLFRSPKGASHAKPFTITMTKNPMRQFYKGMYEDHAVQLNELKDLSPINSWSRASRDHVLWLKSEITNPNLMLFMGLMDCSGMVYSLFDAAGKNNGTLRAVLQNCRFELSDAIKYNLLCGVTDGMIFLHQKDITHGLISSVTLYVDSMWSIRIGHWEMYTMYSMGTTNELPAMIQQLRNYMSDMQALAPLLYFDPAMIHSEGLGYSPQRSKNYDVYSFGLLLVEIFTRTLPFQNEAALNGYGSIIDTKFDPNATPLRPNIDGLSNIPSAIKLLISDCLSEPLTNRPSFITLNDRLRDLNPSTQGILEMLMQTIDDYIEKVEATGKENKNVKKKMENLLNVVLPQQIAEKLFRGQSIEPEYFESITVYFSSLHGFAELAQRFTPQTVMDFLNDLWIIFDRTVDEFDVYKADTIGDAYMVCSGLPALNGTQHAPEIARFALKILDQCQKSQMRQNDQQCVLIKIGINSGPAIAGVIGTKMPQYCIIGDTVNTASRMCTNSVVGKIQLSDATYHILVKHYPNDFTISYRGDIDVKGKGLMTTYWLVPPWKVDRDCTSANSTVGS